MPPRKELPAPVSEGTKALNVSTTPSPLTRHWDIFILLQPEIGMLINFCMYMVEITDVIV